MFFRDIHQVLRESLYLQTCKITDPAKAFGRDNLTVSFLDERLDKLGLLTAEIITHSQALARYRGIVIEARNRLLGHLDANTILRGLPVGAHDAAEVEKFYHHLQEYCDAVGIAVGEGPADFRTLPGKGDVLDLIRLLRRIADQN